MTSSIGNEKSKIFLLNIKFNFFVRINPKRKEIKKMKIKNSILVFKGIPEKIELAKDGSNKAIPANIIT